MLRLIQRLKNSTTTGPLSEITDLRGTFTFFERVLRAEMPRTAYLWYDRLSVSGRLLFSAGLVAGSITLGEGTHRPVYILGFGLLSILLIDAVVSFVRGPTLEIVRILPDRGAAGATLEIRARVTNLGTRPAYDVAASEYLPPRRTRAEISDYCAQIDPGETAELVYRLTPRQRGTYDFKAPLALAAAPLGTHHATQHPAAPHRLLVYPAFRPLAEVDLPVGLKHQPGGLALVSQVGESEEFLGNREYRPGDRLRDLDQAAWARVGRPVVREFQQEYLCRIALVVDTHVAKGDAAGAMALEAAISLGAAVTDALSRQEYVIDLFAVGPDLYHLQAGRSLAYLDSILDILACIEACPENPFDTLGPAMADALDQISSAVVVLLDWDENRERFVSALSDRGIATKVVIVRDGPPRADPSGLVTAAGPVQVFSVDQARHGLERL